MATRSELGFPIFDADNHFYGPRRTTLTKYLPPQQRGAIEYVEVGGRTKLAVRGHITDFIPNPTFERVGWPGRGRSSITTRQPGREEPTAS